jgi:hypothetical protein
MSSDTAKCLPPHTPSSPCLPRPVGIPTPRPGSRFHIDPDDRHIATATVAALGSCGFPKVAYRDSSRPSLLWTLDLTGISTHARTGCRPDRVIVGLPHQPSVGSRNHAKAPGRIFNIGFASRQ